MLRDRQRGPDQRAGVGPHINIFFHLSLYPPLWNVALYSVYPISSTGLCVAENVGFLLSHLGITGIKHSDFPTEKLINS